MTGRMGWPTALRPRRGPAAAWVAAGVLVALMIVPGVLAQDSTPIFQSASMDLVVPLPIAQLQSNVTLSTLCAGSAAGRPIGTAETGNISLDPAKGQFTFTESGGTGCAIAFYPMPLNVTTQRVGLSFWADRRIVQTTTLNFSINMPQQVWFMDRPGHVSAVYPYFRHDEPPQSEAAFNISFEIPPGSTPQVGFYFEDHGPSVEQTIPNPGFQQEFSATVSQIKLRYEGIELTNVQEWDAGIVTAPDSLVHLQYVNVTLAPEASQSSFQLAVRAGPSLGGITGPSGERLSMDDVVSTLEGALLTVHVPANLVAQAGTGTYAFEFQTFLPLPPAPPGPPATLPWLPFIALGMVASAGGLATTVVGRQVAKSTDNARRAARTLLLVVAATWVAAALTSSLVYLLFGGRRLIELPLSGPVVAAYAIVILFAVIFVGEQLRTKTIATQHHLAIQRRQAEALARSNKELESFAYVASHDLQEPLRKIISYSQLLEERFGKRLGKDGKEFIGYTVDGATRMQALIRDLLAYSRIGRSPKPLVPVALDEVLHRVVSDLGPRIKDARTKVKIGPMPRVLGDDGQLGQLFQNLIGNAIKYRAPGRPSVVKVTAARQGASRIIRVEDNGIGIAAEHHEKIFQMFQRLHGRGEYEGTGIGLAICKSTVERHGGDIRVESQLGQGATFVVTLRGAP